MKHNIFIANENDHTFLDYWNESEGCRKYVSLYNNF